MGRALCPGRRQASRKRQGLSEGRQAQGHQDGHATSLGPVVPGGAAGGQRDSTALREACSHFGIQALQEQPIGAHFSRGLPEHWVGELQCQLLDLTEESPRQRSPCSVGSLTWNLTCAGVPSRVCGQFWDQMLSSHFITWQPQSKSQNDLV